MIFEKNLEIFWKSCKFFGFSFYRLSFLFKRNDFHEEIHQICWFSGCDYHLKIKKSAEIYAFWTKNMRFFGNSAPFLCSKDTIDHAASGWCAAVIFWKKATKFAGFLVVIFTSQSKNLQQFLHSEKNLGNFWRFCEFFGFSFYRLAFLSKGNDFHEKIHQICWFSGCDFHFKIKKS